MNYLVSNLLTPALDSALLKMQEYFTCVQVYQEGLRSRMDIINAKSEREMVHLLPSNRKIQKLTSTDDSTPSEGYCHSGQQKTWGVPQLAKHDSHEGCKLKFLLLRMMMKMTISATNQRDRTEESLGNNPKHEQGLIPHSLFPLILCPFLFRPLLL